MADKKGLKDHSDVLVTSGLSGKSITGVEWYTIGNMTVIEIGYSGGMQFLKVRHNQVEVGGTNEWGTGTLQNR